MSIFTLYITSEGAYAGFKGEFFSFFSNPLGFEESPLFIQLKKAPSHSFHIYLDSKTNTFELEDLSCLKHSDLRAYVKNQQPLKTHVGNWAIPFSLTKSHLLWNCIEKKSLLPWLNILKKTPHSVDRLVLTPLEISTLLPLQNFRCPVMILEYEDEYLGYRQVVLIGRIFYLTRLLPYNLSRTEKNIEIDNTKRYIQSRLHFKSADMDTFFLNLSVSEIADRLAQKKPFFDIKNLLRIKSFSPASLNKFFKYIGFMAGTIGCIFLLYGGWLKKCHSALESEVVFMKSKTSLIESQKLQKLVNYRTKIQNFIKNEHIYGPPFLPIYVRAIISNLTPHFLVTSYDWGAGKTSETLTLQLQPKCNTFFKAERKLRTFFKEAPCQIHIVYEDRSNHFKVTFTKEHCITNP